MGAFCFAASMELSSADICGMSSYIHLSPLPSPLSPLLSFCSLIFLNQYINTNLCSNMMPLFHVGGIVRNVFAPLLAGGSLICMPSVDPVLFWDLCDIHNCTWCGFSSIHTSSLSFIYSYLHSFYFITSSLSSLLTSLYSSRDKEHQEFR